VNDGPTLGTMSKATVSQLVPRVPSRGQQYSATTRTALIDMGEQLFTEHGYAATSLDSIVAGAMVTKGALYHHFSGKQALFEAAFERIEGGAARDVTDAVHGHDGDPWEKTLAGLDRLLQVVQQPSYRRIVILEGPAVLGHARLREQSARSTFAVVMDIVGSMLAAGDWDLDVEMVETFTRIFFGAMASAGESVSTSDDPEAAACRVEAAIRLILAGLHALADQGAQVGTTPSH
jgi:AcrR family transcriptional regulator